MDRVTQYRKIVQDFLLNFAADDPEAQLVFDTECDHYLVMHFSQKKNENKNS
jgi:hypothetical protein